jgi:hypothetical protein
MTKQQLALKAADGYPIAATLYPAAGDLRAHLIVASATGVPQGYYRRFAEFAAARGFRVLTLDYRGIGLSRPATLKGFKMDYLDWGRLDLAAAVEHMDASRQDGLPLFMIGHSYGGHALGLLPNQHKIAACYLFATGAGWHGWMPPLERIKVWIMWNIAGPVLTRWKGYLAWSKLGMGEDLPRQQQGAFALVLRQAGGALELGPRLGVAAQPGQQVAAHAGQQVVVAQQPARPAAGRPAPGPPPGRRPCPAPPRDSARRWARAAAGTGRRTARRCAPSRSRSGGPGRARGRRRSRPAGRRAPGCPACGAVQRGQPAPDQQPVPAAAVLVQQQHRFAVRPRAGALARGLDLHQRHQAVHFAFFRRQLGQHAAQAQRLAAQGRAAASRRRRWPNSLRCRSGRSPAAPTPGAACVRRRAAPRTAPSLPPGCAWRARCAGPPSIRAPGRRARSPRVDRPPTSLSVSAARASLDSTGWQATNIRRSTSSSMPSSSIGQLGEFVGLALAVAQLLVHLPGQLALPSRRACWRGAGGRGRGASPPASARRPGRSGTPVRARIPAPAASRPAPAPRPGRRRAACA